MKTDTKKLEKCRVELKVELDADETAAIVRKAEGKVVRNAQMPGFRPGKIPPALVRKNFAGHIERQTKSDLVGVKGVEAVREALPGALDVVEVKDVSYSADGASITLVVDIKPTFKLPSWKGLKIGRNEPKVEDSEVAAYIDRLKAMHARYEDAKEGESVGEGDFAQIDYSGSIDGKPIAEINPDAKMVASGTGFWTLVEEGRFLPELLDAVKGMKAGEKKEGVKAKFAADGSAPEGLGGAEALYELTLKTFRRRILPDEADFLKAVEKKSMQELEDDIRKRMQESADAQEATRRENEAVELLLKKCDFALPASQVERVKNQFLADFAKRAQSSGIDASYFEKNRDKIMADADSAAERQVRLWYILDAIATAEKIEAGDGERNRKALDMVLAAAK